MTPAGAAIAIALALARVQDPPALDAEPGAAAGVERFDSVILDGSTQEPDALEAELRLRLAAHEILVARAEMARPGARFVWVLVQPAEGDAVQLRLITSDGRAFTRLLEVASDQHAREVAGAIANMVDAIENNRIAPQETNAEVPTPPAPAEPASEKAEPEPAPGPEPSPPAVGSAPMPPSSWLGVAIDGGVALAVGPPSDLQGLGGGSVGAGVRWIHRSGALATGELHALLARGGGFMATRVRVYAGAGYAFRPSRFELLAHGGLVVAPVFVTADRGASDLRTASGTRRTAAPLVGGRVAISPGWFLWSRSDHGGLRLGVTIDAAYSVEARSPAGAIRILRDDGDTNTAILRAGGLEIGAAMSLEGRFGIGGE